MPSQLSLIFQPGNSRPWTNASQPTPPSTLIVCEATLVLSYFSLLLVVALKAWNLSRVSSLHQLVPVFEAILSCSLVRVLCASPVLFSSNSPSVDLFIPRVLTPPPTHNPTTLSHPHQLPSSHQHHHHPYPAPRHDTATINNLYDAFTQISSAFEL